jgi:asparaginyl-tRNA synthetase
LARLTPETGAIPGWGYGAARISRDGLAALTRLRAVVLTAIRGFLDREVECIEVTTSTLTQMSGSCENPLTMFQLKYYDRSAFLAQSAQLQLEIIIGLLGRPAYTLASSFRGEDYTEDPTSKRRLTEFTLVEAEGPHWTLETLRDVQERLLACVIDAVLDKAETDLIRLGGSVDRLRALRPPYSLITHADACKALLAAGFTAPADGPDEWDFTMREERELLAQAGGRPLFLISHPHRIKYFNMVADGTRARSVDLLAPPLGEISGGGERESEPARVREHLLSSRMLQRIRQIGGNESEFDWYLRFLEQPGLPARAGFGLGLERLVGFLIGSDDILACIEFPATDRHLFP